MTGFRLCTAPGITARGLVDDRSVTIAGTLEVLLPDGLLRGLADAVHVAEAADGEDELAVEFLDRYQPNVDKVNAYAEMLAAHGLTSKG